MPDENIKNHFLISQALKSCIINHIFKTALYHLQKQFKISDYWISCVPVSSCLVAKINLFIVSIKHIRKCYFPFFKKNLIPGKWGNSSSYVHQFTVASQTLNSDLQNFIVSFSFLSQNKNTKRRKLNPRSICTVCQAGKHVVKVERKKRIKMLNY